MALPVEDALLVERLAAVWFRLRLLREPLKRQA
jgi:hypothetical protein